MRLSNNNPIENMSDSPIKELQVGDPAPSFEAVNQKGETLRLEDFRGQKLVLYFYPKDDTPGCTKEACNLRDHHEALQQAGYRVLGVSIDSEASHQKFIDKHGLPFDLIADPDKELVEKYGVWKEKNMYGKKYMGTARTTFLIDEEGAITKIFKKVKSADHAAQILAT